MADIQFEDYSATVKAVLNDAVIAWLYEAGGELEAQTKRNSRVDTGQLKGSWSYQVDEGAGTATIGSPLENAIWEEFGTGEYATGGSGRRGGWSYQDECGQWHFTVGKTPNRTLNRAFTSLKTKLQKSLEARLRGLD